MCEDVVKRSEWRFSGCKDKSKMGAQCFKAGVVDSFFDGDSKDQKDKDKTWPKMA